MSEQTPEVDANYDNVSLLLAGVVAFLIDNDSNQIDIEYFYNDYSNQQIAVLLDEKTNKFVFELKEFNNDASR